MTLTADLPHAAATFVFINSFGPMLEKEGKSSHECAYFQLKLKVVASIETKPFYVDLE
jgi:hypothetical protein